MKFKDIELNGYLVSSNKSFLYHIIEKDYKEKKIRVEVLDRLRPLLKLNSNFRYKEFSSFTIFEEYKPIIKIEDMNREKLKSNIVMILGDVDSAMRLEKRERIAGLIMDLVPKSSIEQVEEFMVTTNQPTTNKVGEINDRLGFRISLIEEEAKELKDADNFYDIVDALGDIQYVLDGMIIEMGLRNYKDEIIEEIHRSNMSKFDDTINDAKLTAEKYLGEGIMVYNKKVKDKIITYREGDNKVLKSIRYNPPDLQSIINKDNVRA